MEEHDDNDSITSKCVRRFGQRIQLTCFLVNWDSVDQYYMFFFCSISIYQSRSFFKLCLLRFGHALVFHQDRSTVALIQSYRPNDIKGEDVFMPQFESRWATHVQFLCCTEPSTSSYQAGYIHDQLTYPYLNNGPRTF